MGQDNKCLISKGEVEKDRKQVMQKQSLATSHGKADVQPVPKRNPLCPLFICWIWHYMAWHTSLVSWVHLSGYIPSQPLAHPQCIHCRGTEEHWRPWYYAHTVQQQLKHWCITSIILVATLKQSMVRAAVKRINSIPARPSMFWNLLLFSAVQCAWIHCWTKEKQ